MEGEYDTDGGGGGVVVAMTKVVLVMVAPESVIVKCEKCIFFKTKNQIHKTFFCFENEYKSVLKMILKSF